MRSLYPATAPRRAEWLEVGDGHSIYFEEAGNPEGIPIVFLHGGPGSGCKPSHRQFFEPTRYRSFLFDQRGCGRSKPFGSTQHNSTQALISDLEALRRWAGVEAWALFGGSWGAALALAYAQFHPDRVLAMVLRGTFLARKRDLDWFMQVGAARLLPKAWADFVASTREIGQSISALHDAVFGSDSTVAESAARAWAKWSNEVVMYAFDNAPGDAPEPLDHLLGKTRIELHYAINGYFLADNELLTNAHKLPRVPIHVIHGQRDLTCAPEAGWAIHQAVPGSTFEILRTAGHLSGEAPVQDALLRAADAMAERLEAR
ncbi:MAG: prolyl aminopeptidase [Gammaproteobacteria bacterium]|nr:prolyl aminopeptidase [Gammaproteobacteria bacterium]